ncbi:MAG TPA: hypothetical protein VN577_20200 [Terriglobales bacterium]|nr:hypothetical protein [Terriglobales bacterium]
MATRILHYEVKSKVGSARVLVFAFRCSQCLTDFHIALRPEWCPCCGVHFYQEKEFGKQEAPCPAS